ETPHLRVGPVVVPGKGACHACFELRETQHTPRPTEHKVLRDFYNAQTLVGPQGFLQAFADIAAIRLAQLVESLEQDETSIAGHVWRLNTINRDTVSGKVVGVHGCRHCGLGRDEQKRGFVELQRELLSIWNTGFENDATTELEKEVEMILA
ncbi:MAG TPA: TOMM precursor leader peptide-binding protein, partial [Blastocatellia bacterium]|nr:TOMM precursor leader peptide-binding protein [Blastocatellia bacterium]